MPSVDIKAEIQSLASPGSCSRDTADHLKTLLGSEVGQYGGLHASLEAAKTTNPPKKSSARAKAPEGKVKATPNSSKEDGPPGKPALALSRPERVKIASQIFNASLKGLSLPVDTTARTELAEIPLNPVQGRPQQTSGAAVCPAVNGDKAGLIRIVECACVAIDSLLVDQVTPTADLRLENGLLSLVGKLLGHKLGSWATQQLRFFRDVVIHSTKPFVSSVNLKFDCSELLDFDGDRFAGNDTDKLLLLVNYCSLSLRAIAIATDSVNANELSQRLQCSSRSAPHNLLLRYTELSSDKERALRHSVNMSQNMLQMGFQLQPSLSALKDDAICLDPRLRIQLAAIQLRTIGCSNEKLPGSTTEEIWRLFETCLSRYIGTSRPTKVKVSNAQLALTEFEDKVVQNPGTSGLTPACEKTYRTMIELAADGGQLDKALLLVNKLAKLARANVSAQLKLCGILAKRAALTLQAIVSRVAVDNLFDALRDAEISMSGQINGGMADFVVTMRDTAALRKAIARVFHTPQSLEGQSKFPWHSLLDLLGACIRFLQRFLGSSPDAKASDELLSQYQKRLGLVSELSTASIESVLFIVRKAHDIVPSSSPTLSRLLRDCESLLSRLKDAHTRGLQTPGCESDDVKKMNLALATSYWTIAAKSDDNPAAKEALALMLKSCCILETLDNEFQISGQLALKLYRYGRLLSRNGQHAQALNAYEDSIRASIRTGAVDHAVRIITSGSFQGLDGEEHCRILAASLKGSTESRSKEGKSTALVFDDRGLPIESRGLLLEWQLELLLTRNEATFQRAMTENLHARMLEIYAWEQFPIRRMRILSKLLKWASQVGETAQNIPFYDLAKEAANAVIASESLAHDCGLASYQLHLQASLRARLATLSPAQASALFGQALEYWQSLTMRDLNLQIDSTEDWIGQLQIMSAFFDLQGMDENRLTTLGILQHAYLLQSDGRSEDADSNTLEISGLLDRMGHPQQVALFVSRQRLGLSDIDKSFSTRARLACSEAYRVGSTTVVTADKVLEVCRDLLNESQTLVGNKARTGGSDTNLHLTLVAEIYRACALLCREHRTTFEALLLVKKATSVLRYIWRRIEVTQEASRDVPKTAQTPDNRTTPERSNVQRPEQVACGFLGAAFWPIARKLVMGLLDVSSLSRDLGLSQDAKNACEEAKTLADQCGSSFLVAKVLVEQGELACQSAQDGSGSSCFAAAKTTFDEMAASTHKVQMQKAYGYSKHVDGSLTAELSAYEDAEKTISCIVPPDVIALLGINDTPLSEITSGLGTLTLKQKGAKSKTASSSALNRGRVHAGPKSGEVEAIPKVAARGLEMLKFDLMRQKADCYLSLNELSDAEDTLRGLAEKPSRIESSLLVETAANACLVRRSLALMTADTVFAMLPDSSISLPASTMEVRSEERVTSSKSKVRKKAPSQGTITAAKLGARFETILSQALCRLLELQRNLPESCSNSAVSRFSSLLSVTSMMSSFAASLSRESPLDSALIAHTLELPRNTAGHREQINCLTSRILKEDGLGPTWPQTELLPQSGYKVDEFQTEFVDIIPDDWIVVSLTLAEDFNHLYVVKYNSGVSPFILRLPLARQNSEEALDEALTFEEARNEMSDIIKSSDETILRGRSEEVDMKSKSEKTKWWSQRQELDERIRSLLMNIESLWLGGFRSVFSGPVMSHVALKQFRDAFSEILESSLPSRRQSKNVTTSRVSLDSRIYELFVGLGDPSEEGAELEEALTDLLYFVVDILQFNGERNAYDEIDFDAMIIDTQDALKAYHQACDVDKGAESSRDVVLVLDKRLHGFPWECIPCLQGRSVSRLSSMLELRDRIQLLRLQMSGASAKLEGVRVSRSRGTYILNPSSDLPKTEARFARPLLSSSVTKSWTSVVHRAPSEAEMISALAMPPGSKEMPCMLYIGHGSGAQYIRNKAIRRLYPHCGAALLFGCSSAALKEQGEFEPSGPVKAYLCGGAPVVLGALWDVTDGDCDAFAGAVLGRWGVLDEAVSLEGLKGRKQRDKKSSEKTSRSTTKDRKKCSLSKAVAQGREECFLKYLNGSAMVVYGVPCYLAD